MDLLYLFAGSTNIAANLSALAVNMYNLAIALLPH